MSVAQMEFLQSYAWMFDRPRDDGIFPQSCAPSTNGTETSVNCVYGQGANHESQSLHSNQDLDTCAFAVKSLFVSFTLLPAEEATALFLKYKSAMLKSMEATQKDPDGSGESEACKSRGWGEVHFGCSCYVASPCYQRLCAVKRTVLCKLDSFAHIGLYTVNAHARTHANTHSRVRTRVHARNLAMLPLYRTALEQHDEPPSRLRIPRCRGQIWRSPLLVYFVLECDAVDGNHGQSHRQVNACAVSVLERKGLAPEEDNCEWKGRDYVRGWGDTGSDIGRNGGRTYRNCC